jgi:uncharacterized OB-fold protein
VTESSVTAAGAPQPLLPDVASLVSAPFWSAARRHRFVLQTCAACGHVRWTPSPICPECLGAESEWKEQPGGGTVWGAAAYHRALYPAFEQDVPYVVALVELDAGPKMIGRVIDALIEEDLAGARVSVTYLDVTPEVTLVGFRLDH